MIDLDFLFNPEQIAVIGASKSPHKIGHAILDNIINSGYQGEIYPINPGEEEISGYKVYSSVNEVNKPIDLAIISVPVNHTIKVAEECGKAGIKGLIVITAGFKEVGREGLKLEQELTAICNHYQMRMLGPNCVGIMDTHTPLNASFANGFPNEGNISLISQSGAMLVSILDWSFEMGMGFSRFISTGNKADLTEIDLIESCAADPNTSVILCYIEDITDGERFVEVCSEASKKKPIVILKSGISSAGAQAASSHTGALAGSNRAYEAAFRQSGVLRAETMNELFDLARAFSSQPLPEESRVAVVTNAGGPGILATDAVEKYNLKMARFTKDTNDKLRNNLPQEANIYNPVDIIGDARDDRYRFALQTVLEDENVDSAVVILCPAAVTEPEKTAHTIVDLNKKCKGKPVMAVYIGGRVLAKGKNYLSENAVPNFTFPEPSISALEGMVKYNRLLKEAEPAQPAELKNIDQDTVREIVDQVLADRRVVLLGHEASTVMSAYGIPVSKTYLATSEEEASEISIKLGYPVALKISSPRIAHKTDVGGVAIGLHSEKEVKKAYWQIMENVNYYLPDAPIYGIEVQEMVDEGVEIIVGMSRDVQFGPLVVFGLGGIYVNLLEDVSFRLASALDNHGEVKQMIAETKAYTMLKGYRGKKSADIEALSDTILRTARLVRDFGEITEMDINPVRVHTKGSTALDVKITIEERDKQD
ncbi:MAG: acetate--CoA ligase family protein [Bacillota bacterium]